MHKKAIYRIILVILLIINIIALIAICYRKLNDSIPNDISIIAGQTEEFDFAIPVQAVLSNDHVKTININNRQFTSRKVNIDFNKPFTIMSEQKANFSVQLNLFGILKFKKINIDVIDTVEVLPSGEPIGIYVKTNGIMVLGTSIITGMDGTNYEPASNKLKSGDYITSVNGNCVNSKKDLIEAIQSCKGKDLCLEIRRNEEIVSVSVSPVETAVGEYKIGTWIRDDTQGIGTLTYITPNGRFGALGHGITDVDTSLLMEVSGGNVFNAEIMSIIKGKNGNPGELIGLINQNEKYKVGTISYNTHQGIFGDIDEKHDISKYESVEICLKQDIKLGEAIVRCNVNGEVDDYKINIEKVDRNSDQLSKGLVIEIVDERLLSLTGGIVQGMSGSPILQNGKLIGAVTHVFINNPTKGYGIFIENMLQKQ